jgi:hypothetical protein
MAKKETLPEDFQRVKEMLQSCALSSLKARVLWVPIFLRKKYSNISLM